MKIPKCIVRDRIRNSRLNSREVKEVKEYLIWRDGERCNNENCRTRLDPSRPKVPLDIDHVDNNGYRHFHENLQLLCKSCNIRKNPRGRGRRNKKDNDNVCVRVCVTEPEPPKPRSAEMERNQRAEVPFQEAFEEFMQDKIRVSYDEMFRDTWAMEFGVSQMTINRYVGKITSDSSKAKFVLNKNIDKKKAWIEWKPEHNPFRDQIDIFGKE